MLNRKVSHTIDRQLASKAHRDKWNIRDDQHSLPMHHEHGQKIYLLVPLMSSKENEKEVIDINRFICMYYKRSCPTYFSNS
jgi:hypothetical protein